MPIYSKKPIPRPIRTPKRPLPSDPRRRPPEPPGDPPQNPPNMGRQAPTCSSGLCHVDSPAWAPPVVLPLDYHIVAPYVRVEFDGWWYTVGNESSPDNNAVISSFQYGCSGGPTNGSDGVTVEITDQEGSDFSYFMINLLPKSRDEGAPAANCNMIFEFGWAVTNCQGVKQCIKSRRRKCYPIKVDVAFQGGGVIKYTITANNPTEVIAEGVNTKNKVYRKYKLKPAITQMFQENGIQVQYLSAVSSACGGGGGCGLAPLASSEYCIKPASYGGWSFRPDDGGCPGHIFDWATNNKDPVSAAMAWLQNKMTSSSPNRGFVVGTCNLASNQPTVIFWESPLPDCSGASKMQNIGTFIVNGGRCSPVIEFKPQIQFHVANVNQGGTPSGETTGKGQDVEATTYSDITCNVSGKGTNQKHQIPNFNSSKHPTKAPEFTGRALAANARAQPPTGPIQAELTVQGMPDLDDPMALCAGVECAIVVVNPYILSPGASAGDCPDWLVNPPANEFLSNRHWMIDGVSHHIKEGNFTTTLHVWLATPTVLLDRGAPLGGPPGPVLAKT